MPHIFDAEAVCQHCGKTFKTESYRVHQGTAKFCNKICQGRSRVQDPVAYFWAHVKKGPGCWLWQGPIDISTGYGRLVNDGEQFGAHRFSYELAHGPLPVGLDACHTCDNPPCVRPSHLFAGTHKKNMDDRDAKGRVQHGEQHVNSKLTDAKVKAIRRAVIDKRATFRALAKQYGVSHGAINDLVHYRTWKHVA